MSFKTVSKAKAKSAKAIGKENIPTTAKTITATTSAGVLDVLRVDLGITDSSISALINASRLESGR